MYYSFGLDTQDTEVTKELKLGHYRSVYSSNREIHSQIIWSQIENLTRLRESPAGFLFEMCNDQIHSKPDLMQKPCGKPYVWDTFVVY